VSRSFFLKKVINLWGWKLEAFIEQQFKTVSSSN